MSAAKKNKRPSDDDHHDDSDDSDGEQEEDANEVGQYMIPSASSSSSSSSSSSGRQQQGQQREKKTPKAARKSDRDDFTRADAEDAYDDMEGRQIGDKCKDKYNGMIKQMTEFGVKHYEDLMEDSLLLPCPIPIEIVKGFFGTLTKTGSDRDKLKGVEELQFGVDYPVPLSHSHVRTHGSAVKYFYKQNGKSVVDEQVAMCMNDVIGSYKKCIASLRRKGLYKVSEGKRPLLFQGLVMLCSLLLIQTPTQRSGQSNWGTYSFGWAFLTVMWSLMSRSDSIDQLTFHHLEWDGDCMKITEQCTKSDQGGEKIFGKHMYANPNNPTVCPILALAVTLFMRPATGNMLVFVGTNTKDRFGNLLHHLLSALDPTQKVTLGCREEDIGLHSSRKGSASHCLGQPGGPNICAVFLRMNHSLGALRDRYIHEGEGADALCGRMVVGLDFNSISFAVLPPHFKTATSALLTDDFWRTILPNFDNLPTPFKSCLPFLLASLLYHEDFLRNKFPPAHSLWSAPVFAHNQMYDQLKAGLLLGVGYCEDTHMSATGIPPHLAIAKQVNDMIREEG